MKLILFRHGLAVDRELAKEKLIDDAARALTKKGIAKTQLMAFQLRALIGEVQILATSPLLRAKQTAKIIAQEIPVEKTEECSELVPQAPPEAFVSWLKSHAALSTSVLVVGHEPQLGTLATWLLSGQKTSFLDFKKSGFIILEVESFESLAPGTAELKMFLNPKVFQQRSM